MPMPHRTFVQVAKRRLVGKEGTERVRMLRGLIEELPDYRSGPYADIRKWLYGEIDADARPREGRPPRLDRGSPRGRRAGRARRRAERGEVVAPPGAVADPDQDRRLRVHDDASGRGGHARSAVSTSSSSRSRACSRARPRIAGAVARCSACFETRTRSSTATPRRPSPDDLASLRARSRRPGSSCRRSSRRRRWTRRTPASIVSPRRSPISSSCPSRCSTTRASIGSVRRSGACSGSSACTSGMPATWTTSRLALPPGGDRRGRRGCDPPRARREFPRGADLGSVGPLRRTARRARSRRRRSRRGGDRALTREVRPRRRGGRRRSPGAG